MILSNMKTILVTLTVLLIVTITTIRSDVEIIGEERLENEWLQFKEQFQRRFESEEEEKSRRKIFAENLAKIERHNREYQQGLQSWSMGIDQFVDQTEEELSNIGCVLPMSDTELSVEHQSDTDDYSDEPIPAELDWTKKGIVSAVKEQGVCGACWAFSATGVLESATAKATGKLVSLSAQHLISCSRKDGCNGGYPELALYWIIENNGLDTEESYPYEQLKTKKVSPCRANETGKVIGARLKEAKVINSGDENDLLKKLVKYGPISVVVDGKSLGKSHYHNGTYSGDCNSKAHHAVLLVGYGIDNNGTAYWKLKNSWGQHWGWDGYINIKRGVNHCGIANRAVYAIPI